jgi:hypothetical protein
MMLQAGGGNNACTLTHFPQIANSSKTIIRLPKNNKNNTNSAKPISQIFPRIHHSCKNPSWIVKRKNQLTEEGVLIWREEGMAMAAVLAIIGRGGLLFVFREESLVCFFCFWPKLCCSYVHKTNTGE